MGILYQIGVQLLGLGIRIAAPLKPKAKKWTSGRKDWKSKLILDFKNNTSDVMWIHCASVGEFEQGRPVIEKIKKKNSNMKILLTFFSPSGYELRKDYKHADWVYYLPLDSKKNAWNFVNTVKPKVVIFVKYEIWPNFFQEIKKQGIPLILISAIFRKDHRFFKSRWWAKQLRLVSHFFVQNEDSQSLLNSIGITRVQVSGDTRFDRVADIASKVKELPMISRFVKNDLLLVMGSSWEADEKLLQNYLSSTELNFKVIVAPHEIEKSRMKKLNTLFGENSLLYSEATMEKIDRSSILIIDNIGMLSQIYRYADIAYIGGGFGTGIHNILEAATFGMPVLFGPKYHVFQEAKDLIENKAAFSITDQEEFNSSLQSFVDSESDRMKCKSICESYVSENQGATDEIYEFIKAIDNQ